MLSAEENPVLFLVLLCKSTEMPGMWYDLLWTHNSVMWAFLVHTAWYTRNRHITPMCVFRRQYFFFLSIKNPDHKVWLPFTQPRKAAHFSQKRQETPILQKSKFFYSDSSPSSQILPWLNAKHTDFLFLDKPSFSNWNKQLMPMHKSILSNNTCMGNCKN